MDNRMDGRTLVSSTQSWCYKSRFRTGSAKRNLLLFGLISGCNLVVAQSFRFRARPTALVAIAGTMHSVSTDSGGDHFMECELGINASAAIYRSPIYRGFFVCSCNSGTASADHYKLFAWTVSSPPSFVGQISAVQPLHLSRYKNCHSRADRLLRHTCIGTRGRLRRPSATSHVGWVFLCISVGAY